MGLSTYLANKLADKVLRNTDFTVTTVYVSLHTGNPGLTGSNEVAAGGYTYARQTVTSDAPSSGATQNTARVRWSNMPAATVTYVGLWDALSGGNFLWGGALTASKTVPAGEAFEFPVADLDSVFT